MKVPNNISTLTELKDFMDKNNPLFIAIDDNSELLKIKKFNNKEWRFFRGVKIVFMKKYKMTESARKARLKMVDFDKRIDILILRNQGWTFRKIAEKYGTSVQAVQQLYNKIKDMTVEELEEQRKMINEK